jgi:thiol-disulfide isomerase/thioredoxin
MRFVSALLAVLLALAGAGLVACSDDPPRDPKLAGVLVGGGPYDPAGHQGKVTVVNFWGSWCPPCRYEMPGLVAAYQQLSPEGVVFLGVNIRDPDQDKAQAFVDNFKVPYPSLRDPAGKLALEFDIPPSSIPTTLVLGRDGRPAHTFRGVVETPELVAAVREVLADG